MRAGVRGGFAFVDGDGNGREVEEAGEEETRGAGAYDCDFGGHYGEGGSRI